MDLKYFRRFSEILPRIMGGGQAGVHKFGLTQKYNNIYRELIYLTGEEGGLRYESAEGYHRQEADVHGMKGGGEKTVYKQLHNSYYKNVLSV